MFMIKFTQILFIISFSLIISLSTIAQKNKTDSILSIYKRTKVDTIKVNLLLEICTLNTNTNPDTAIHYGKLGLNLAKKIKEFPYIIQACNCIGTVYTSKREPSNALRYFSDAFQLLKKGTDLRLKTDVLINMGVAYSQLGKFQEAEIRYSEAIEIAKKCHYEKGIGRIHFNIGKVYSDRGQYHKALPEFQKALDMFVKLKDLDRIAKLYFNICIGFVRQNDFLKAEYYAKKAEYALKFTNNKIDLSGLYTNLSTIYFDSKQYYKSIYFANKSIEIAKNINITSNKPINLCNIAASYICILNYDKAVEYLYEALETSKAQKNIECLTDSYINMSSAFLGKGFYKKALVYNDSAFVNIMNFENINQAKPPLFENYALIYEKLRNYPKALKYYKLFKQNNDSVFNLEKIKTISNLDLAYETEKKDANIKELLLENKLKEVRIQRVISIAISATLLFIILVIILYAYYKRRERDRSIEIEENLKNDFFEATHSWGNTLGSIEMLLNENKQQVAKEITASIANEIRNRSHFLQSKEFDECPFHIVINELISTFQEFFPKEIDLTFTEEKELEKLSLPQKQVVYRALQELLQNTRKHAQATMVNINIEKKRNKMAISYEDDGRGAEKTTKGGRGLEGIRKNIDCLRGKMKIDTAPQCGYNCIIEFPIKQFIFFN